MNPLGMVDALLCAMNHTTATTYPSPPTSLTCYIIPTNHHLLQLTN